MAHRHRSGAPNAASVKVGFYIGWVSKDHWLDEGQGTGQAGAGGGSALRLCTLSAQSPLTAQGGVPAGGGKRADGAGGGAERADLLQGLQEPGAGDRTGDRHRGSHARIRQVTRYCLEMICADFLAGAHLEGGNPKILLLSMVRLFRLLPTALRQEFLQEITEAA